MAPQTCWKATCVACRALVMWHRPVAPAPLYRRVSCIHLPIGAPCHAPTTQPTPCHTRPIAAPLPRLSHHPHCPPAVRPPPYRRVAARPQPCMPPTAWPLPCKVALPHLVNSTHRFNVPYITFWSVDLAPLTACPRL